MSLFRDEHGKPSMARVALGVTLAATLLLSWLDALFPDTVVVPPDAYAMLGGIVLALAGWAGGPRVMQYLGPQVGKLAGSIAAAAAARDPREPSRHDDERGDQ